MPLARRGARRVDVVSLLAFLLRRLSSFIPTRRRQPATLGFFLRLFRGFVARFFTLRVMSLSASVEEKPPCCGSCRSGVRMRGLWWVLREASSAGDRSRQRTPTAGPNVLPVRRRSDRCHLDEPRRIGQHAVAQPVRAQQVSEILPPIATRLRPLRASVGAAAAVFAVEAQRHVLSLAIAIVNECDASWMAVLLR
jgi:hypothetical protein